MSTRILHTADWHLGARLIECDRHAEHEAFVAWLLSQLVALRPDLLIIAGDIFDSANPPQEALTLYYTFLSELARKVKCRTLILGGNHDSPATLHAPREILRALDVHVVAAPPADPAAALLELSDAVVCAVPYLRERDVRTAQPGQSADLVAAAIREGIGRHYADILARARTIAGDRVIVGTGHLTATGSTASPSERTIHIGNLGAVDTACFTGFAYTALGHIHRPQRVGAGDSVRYAGSPIPLSFSEVDLPKEFRVIDIAGGQLTQHAVAIPEFRPLRRLTASVATLAAELARHQGAAGGVLEPWVELTVTDGRTCPDLDRQVREAAAPLRLSVLKVLTPAPAAGAGGADAAPPPRSLTELRPEDVFAERLRRETIDPASPESIALTQTFHELLGGLYDTAPAIPPEAAP